MYEMEHEGLYSQTYYWVLTLRACFLLSGELWSVMKRKEKHAAALNCPLNKSILLRVILLWPQQCMSYSNEVFQELSFLPSFVS